jgi:ribosomal protein L11 methyltransferase
MAWQRVAVVVAGTSAAALAEALDEAGAISVEIGDADAGTAREQALFGEPGADMAPWARARVTSLFPMQADASQALAAAMERAGVAALESACIDRLEDTDWVAQTQRQFPPMRIGERLWIVTTWHEAPEPGGVNIVLDPGAAFGTGSHPTTRLCISWLERHVDGNATVLDYGCGSGILGIVALKLGARAATGIDIDPLALEAARYNARRNGVALRVLSADEASGEPPASLTVANILANPLRMLAPVIAAHTQPGGRIALSGVLESQAHEVARAYAPHAKLDIVAREEDWVLLEGTRPTPAC